MVLPIEEVSPCAAEAAAGSDADDAGAVSFLPQAESAKVAARVSALILKILFIIALRC